MPQTRAVTGPYIAGGIGANWLQDTTLNGSVDKSGRPMFIEATYGDTSSAFRSGRIMGRPTFIGDHVKNAPIVGFQGDWSQVIWGQIGGISYDVSDQATLDMSVNGDGTGIVSLWQQNMLAIRVEAEFGVLVNDPEAFVKLTDATLPISPLDAKVPAKPASTVVVNSSFKV
jgi:hypothetical protein